MKIALGKFLVIALKNRSNQIRSNEIRIRRELLVVINLPEKKQAKCTSVYWFDNKEMFLVKGF